MSKHCWYKSGRWFILPSVAPPITSFNRRGIRATSVWLALQTVNFRKMRNGRASDMASWLGSWTWSFLTYFQPKAQIPIKSGVFVHFPNTAGYSLIETQIPDNAGKKHGGYYGSLQSHVFPRPLRDRPPQNIQALRRCCCHCVVHGVNPIAFSYDLPLGETAPTGNRHEKKFHIKPAAMNLDFHGDSWSLLGQVIREKCSLWRRCPCIL